MPERIGLVDDVAIAAANIITDLAVVIPAIGNGGYVVTATAGLPRKRTTTQNSIALFSEKRYHDSIIRISHAEI
jgi:hypothetical protein